ncbi:hypothetical protein E2C01_013135 [Portunus trituberculatus]|uniref:Uncharacterized protein n=1 Tax=Portunus trituberculatus TaxID=210409 RepID=A0A5B7DFU2_PORTR|nr:hypothetical protein [Portunus trituberculatus]
MLTSREWSTPRCDTCGRPAPIFYIKQRAHSRSSARQGVRLDGSHGPVSFSILGSQNKNQKLCKSQELQKTTKSKRLNHKSNPSRPKRVFRTGTATSHRHRVCTTHQDGQDSSQTGTMYVPHVRMDRTVARPGGN